MSDGNIRIENERQRGLGWKEIIETSNQAKGSPSRGWAEL